MTRTLRSPARRNGASSSSQPAAVRVAIYCRQSVDRSEEGEFGSIEAQREAVEAYVLSQRGEGWCALPERYDDGGFSGKNTDRPAFQRLLRDIEAGRVDLVAVYKIDRLSRSLLDFTQLMQGFRSKGVGFVSVTQSFDTSNSVGRMVLNLLATFAEFERETISERTRDKIAASRRRGLWTGGRPVLGFDVESKRLVVNAEEAAQVREIFGLYLELGTLLNVVAELRQRGWRTKSWTNQKGRHVAGQEFTKNTVHGLLTNPLYLGKIRCGDALHDGLHDAIVDEETWNAVQEQLRSNAGGRTTNAKGWRSRSLLSGLARCGVCGAAMSPTHTKKGQKRYTYYVCSRHLSEGAGSCPGSRVAAGRLETFVVERLREIGRDPAVLAATLEADWKDREARKPELIAEGRRLVVERVRLQSERRNLLDAVAQGGSAATLLLQKLDEVTEALDAAKKREASVHRELQALELGALDPDEVREAIQDLDPIWDELFPQERARVLALLLEEVRFDASRGEVAITFRPGGPKALLRGGHGGGL